MLFRSQQHCASGGKFGDVQIRSCVQQVHHGEKRILNCEWRAGIIRHYPDVAHNTRSKLSRMLVVCQNPLSTRIRQSATDMLLACKTVVSVGSPANKGVAERSLTETLRCIKVSVSGHYTPRIKSPGTTSQPLTLKAVFVLLFILVEVASICMADTIRKFRCVEGVGISNAS